MRGQSSNPLAEGLAYLFIAILAALVIAHAATAPAEPHSPDLHLYQGR